MPPKKPAIKKDATPAPDATVESSKGGAKAKKSEKTSTPKAEAVAATKRPARKATTVATSTRVDVALVAEPMEPVKEVEAAAQPPRPAISADDIRQAAFFLSQRRRGPSDPVADWLEAERLLLQRAS